jgi:prepilin-type N-terminal cleavage/methylation domain-containing protein
VRERLLREESGFTLAEVMVTIMLMLTVMFALYNIFDMGLRVFSFGNSKVEAVENARLGLGKMERERSGQPTPTAKLRVTALCLLRGLRTRSPSGMI